MKYYLLNGILKSDSEYCEIDKVPKGVRNLSFRMAEGDRMGDRYVEDAKAYMVEDDSGIVLSDFITNTNSILPVSKRMKEIIESMAECEIEYLPFSLVNPRGRIASSDYFIINVIGSFDCLDMDASDICYSEKYPDEILGVDHFVLSVEKVKEAPHIFRVQEVPREYVISETLLNAFRDAELTNINVKELEVK